MIKTLLRCKLIKSRNTINFSKFFMKNNLKAILLSQIETDKKNETTTEKLDNQKLSMGTYLGRRFS